MIFLVGFVLVVLLLIIEIFRSSVTDKILVVIGCLFLGFWLSSLYFGTKMPSDNAIIRQFQTWTPLFDKASTVLSRRKNPVFICSEYGSIRKNPVEYLELTTLASGFQDVYGWPLKRGDCESLAIFFERKTTQDNSFYERFYEPESKGIAFLPNGWKAVNYRYLVDSTDHPPGIEGLDTEVLAIYFRHLEGNWYIYLQHQSW